MRGGRGCLEAEAKVFNQLGIRSLVVVPLSREGSFIFWSAVIDLIGTHSHVVVPAEATEEGCSSKKGYFIVGSDSETVFGLTKVGNLCTFSVIYHLKMKN